MSYGESKKNGVIFSITFQKKNPNLHFSPKRAEIIIRGFWAGPDSQNKSAEMTFYNGAEIPRV